MFDFLVDHRSTLGQQTVASTGFWGNTRKILPSAAVNIDCGVLHEKKSVYFVHAERTFLLLELAVARAEFNEQVRM